MRNLLLVVAALALAGRAHAQGAEETAFWQRLGDSTLVRLTGAALAANHDIEAAAARVRQARAARLQAGLDFAPTITVAGSYTRQRVAEGSFGFAVPDRGLWDAEARLSWEVDVFGRLRRRYRGHDRLAASSEADLRDTRLALAAELATAYFELRGAQEQLAVAQRNSENQRRTLQLTRDLLDAGRGDEFDTSRAQAQLSSTLARIPVLESGITAARNRIAALLGLAPDAATVAMAPAAEFPELPQRIAVDDQEALIGSRPDVQAAAQRVGAEQAFVGAARADYLPRLSVGGSAGFTATSLDSLGRSGSGRYVIGPVLTWPALNLGRVKASVDAARALESEAQARYEQIVLNAREELASALAGYTGARDRMDRLTEAAAASSHAAELARLRFEGGLEDFLQVLDAERSMLAAQDELARSRSEAAAALVRVYRAMGG